MDLGRLGQLNRTMKIGSVIVIALVVLITPLFIAKQTNFFSHAGISIFNSCTPFSAGLTKQQIRQLSASGQVNWCGITKKVVFPLGMYVSYPTESDFQGMQSIGVNLIYDSDDIYFGDADSQRVNKILDLADKYDIKVILGMYDGLSTDGAVQNKVHNFVLSVKDHPALYGYYLVDEPEIYGTDPQAVRALHTTIKNADKNPKHYTIAAYASFDLDKARKYFGIADISAFDIYPFSYSDYTKSQRLTAYRLALQNFIYNNPAKAYFIIPQAFQSNSLSLRTPSREELEDFINTSLGTDARFQGLLSFAWRSVDWKVNGLVNLHDLQSTFMKIHDKYRNRHSDVGITEYIESPNPTPTPMPSGAKCQAAKGICYFRLSGCPNGRTGTTTANNDCQSPQFCCVPQATPTPIPQRRIQPRGRNFLY